ncbi:MAG: hypothetical protein HC804_07780 [Anaerolineae bacterium]|nr:hypothetical protein [Anaerolineae bacterium]
MKKSGLYLSWPQFLAVCLLLTLVLAACGSEKTAPALPEGYMVGPTNQCQASPQFLSGLNFEQPVLDTTQEFAVGLLVRDLAGDGAGEATADHTYQHDTWDDAGKVGPFAIRLVG